MNQEQNSSRRKFMQQSAALSAGIMFAGANGLFAENKQEKKMLQDILSKGYAGMGTSGNLSLWSFERRALGDNDILIDIKYSGICHSDIHQIKGHWGPQRYPQVPGHEIAGIVAAVGKNVAKFKDGDRAGVGCMVISCMECESCKNGEEHHCDNNATVWTYGSTDETSPSGITQGGYSTNIVVKDHFAVKIPESISLQDAAPLLCAGITTYS